MLNDLEEMLAVYSEWEYQDEMWQDCVQEYLEELDELNVPVPRVSYVKEVV